MRAQEKTECLGVWLKRLSHKQLNRGMELIPEQSRCIQRQEIHEIVTTDQEDVAPGSLIKQVGYLGFAEFAEPGVIDVGDEACVGGDCIGRVIGFDQCHFPNHYNILIKTEKLISGEELPVRIGDQIVFKPLSKRTATTTSNISAIPVIYGYGNAGRMHLDCVTRAFNELGCAGEIVVVDQRAEKVHVPNDSRNIHMYRRLSSVPEHVCRNAVLHICTPPRMRCEVLEKAIGFGIHRFIIEKPMVANERELQRIVHLAANKDIDLLVVANWLFSNLTERLEKRVRFDLRENEVSTMRISHYKSRITLSSKNDSHGSAFDVEIPHMASLALRLSGVGARLVQARTWDLTLDEVTIPDMGGAEIVLQTEQGYRAYLSSDLMSPMRERKITVELKDKSRIEGYYPCSSADHFSQLCVFDANNNLIEKHYFEDDTLTNFMRCAYAYFEGKRSKPCSNIQFHTAVCDLLNEARRKCTEPTLKECLVN